MDMDQIAAGAGGLVLLALLIGALTWRAGLGWLPVLLIAVPAAIWLPNFFFSPWQRSDLLWTHLAGWPLLVIAAAAAWTLRHRVRWFAWDGRNLIASLVLGWLGAALVTRGGLEVFTQLPDLLASPNRDGLSPATYKAVILAMLPLMAFALWVVGVAAGRLIGLPLIAILRRTRGLGYYSPRLKFRHRPGDETVEWHYFAKEKPRGWTRRDIPLRRLAYFHHETRTDQVYERTYQTFEARGQYSGEVVTGTIEGPGYWRTRITPTGRSTLTIGDLAMTLPTRLAVAANNTLDVLFKRYVHALHRSDKARTEQEMAEARRARAAAEEQARHDAAAKAAADRQREIDDDARHQARVEQSRIDAHANMQALLAQAGLSGSDLWSKYAHDLDGRIVALIAASRSGRGVIVHGGDTWQGDWRGASVRLADDRLHVQVDDPDWRRQHLSERRFVLGERWTAEERQTWADRIGLLAAGGA